MSKGTIKRVVLDVGFGFSQADGAMDEVFFHSSHLGFEAEPDMRQAQRSLDAQGPLGEVART